MKHKAAELEGGPQLEPLTPEQQGRVLEKLRRVSEVTGTPLRQLVSEVNELDAYIRAKAAETKE